MPGSPSRPEDRRHIQAALAQAAHGLGRTAPNPAVGCVIVDRAGVIIAEGFHERAGRPHAEVVALEKAGPAAAGSTVYVTLEPCSHWGRTPPCADALIRAGVSRVVAAMADPDPRVQGRGFQRLRDANIEVQVGPGGAAARRLNEGYIKVKQDGLPFLLLKMAMTLDGKIATPTGDSRWVTGPAARSYVQELRDRADAVMVGVGTVLADNPSLTVRPAEFSASVCIPRNHARVVLDSRGRLPLDAKVIILPGRRLLMTTDAAPKGALDELRSRGVEVHIVESEGGRVSLPAAMRRLAEEGLQWVLMEGGAEAAASAIRGGMVDRLLFFIAPKILGGSDSPGPVGGEAPYLMDAAHKTGRLHVRRFGPDLAIETDLLTTRFNKAKERGKRV